MKIKGQIISGEFGKVIARQKAGQGIEIGELLISEAEGSMILMQVTDLLYGSQISRQSLELISGLSLEEGSNADFYDGNLRNYNLAILKSLITIGNKGTRLNKNLPIFLSPIREIDEKDLSFITQPENPLCIGKLRSGSKALDVEISLPGVDTLSHHILIAASTGKGKSNLASTILWNSMKSDYSSFLVLDPHDEYYGRNRPGLKDHPRKEKLVYYTPHNPPPGARSLRINLAAIKPHHFDGVSSWTPPQRQALGMYYRKYAEGWIEAVVMDKKLSEESNFFQDGTISVIRRKLLSILDLDWTSQQLSCNGIFVLSGGDSTIPDICSELESSKIVIIDTSSFSGEVEILIGSLISAEIFRKYRQYKHNGQIDAKPVLSILLEEAPRVLGKDAIEKGPNIFSTIAREGRKFKVGLTAITQLPSLIPREILANMNTKIILGMEMSLERQAVIDSASQDLSDDSRNIASLDIGEAIITSNFSRFATPVKIPSFTETVKKESQKSKAQKSFHGMG